MQTTGYVRCKQCNAAGEWEIEEPSSFFRVMAKVLAGDGMYKSGVVQGKIALYDGSSRNGSRTGKNGC